MHTVSNEERGNQGPDLQNILRDSYDFLTIIPQSRSTYDGSLIYQTFYEERKAFRYDSVAYCKIVGDSVNKLAYGVPKQIFARYKSLS